MSETRPSESVGAPLYVLLFPSLLFGAFGLCHDSWATIAKGWAAILTSPSLLVTDYLAVGGVGAAFLNAAALGLLATMTVRLIRAERPGYEIAGVFLITGFGLFGKNLLNVWPHIIGVLLFRHLAGRPLKDLFPPLVFGTTLAPIVSQYAFGPHFGSAGPVVGVALGILSGFLLSALAGHMLSLHLGYTLYSVGTAGGFVGIVVTMVMRGFGVENAPVFLWSTDHTGPLRIVMLALFGGLALLGLLAQRSNHGSLAGATTPLPRRLLDGWQSIMARSGKLPCDFVQVAGIGPTLVNMGVLGLLGLTYVCAVGGVVNGPIVAGLCALAGFGALGKHPRNVVPIMAGVLVICIPKIWSPGDPGPLLAALFCTSLAPFCGRFGPLAGFIAGALHLPMVMHIAAIHGFLNLYNNGFAGGLTMIILVGVIKGINPGLLEEPSAER